MAFPVRSFKVNDKRYTLMMDIEDDDTTKVIDQEGNEIGLKFDHSTNAYYKDEKIGRLRLPFTGEPDNIQFVHYKNKPEEDAPIDTGAYKEKVECYLDAEVFVAKYLIENGFIKIEEETNG